MAGRKQLFQNQDISRISITLPREMHEDLKAFALRRYKGSLSAAAADAFRILMGDDSPLRELQESLETAHSQVDEYYAGWKRAWAKFKRAKRSLYWSDLRRRYTKRQVYALKKALDAHGIDPEAVTTKDPMIQEFREVEPSLVPGASQELYRKIREKILSFLRGLGTAACREQHLKDLFPASKTMVSRALRRLLRQGLVLRSGRGTPGNAYVYQYNFEAEAQPE